MFYWGLHEMIFHKYFDEIFSLIIHWKRYILVAPDNFLSAQNKLVYVMYLALRRVRIAVSITNINNNIWLPYSLINHVKLIIYANSDLNRLHIQWTWWMRGRASCSLLMQTLSSSIVDCKLVNKLLAVHIAGFISHVGSLSISSIIVLR